MFEIDWTTPHLWRKTSVDPKVRDSLAGDVEVDVVIVGGGFTGLSSALAAAATGARVALLEANKIGSAASGRNNGMVISHHSKASPSEIEQAYGPPYGKRYNALVAGAAKYAFSLMEKYRVDCHQVQNGWIQPAHSLQALARGRKFHDEWKAFGHSVEWIDGTEITERLGSRYAGGWMARDSGHINPYALAQGLACAAVSEGISLFEHSQVVSIAQEGERWRLRTDGGTILASQVVLATNALTGKFWPKLSRALIPVQIYQAATAPISPKLVEAILVGNPAVSDTRRDIRAFHYDRDFRIVTGGTLTLWHNAKARGKTSTSRMLAQAFPQLGKASRVEEYWEGVVAVVPDRKPRLMRLAPGIVFGGIYSGRGVALSLALGQKIGQWAAGKIADDDLPLPVTNLRLVPMQPIAVRVARNIHPLHRLQDRFS